MALEPIKKLINNDRIQQIKVATYRGYDLIVTRAYDETQERWFLRLDASTKDKRMPCIVSIGGRDWPADKQITESNLDEFLQTKVWASAFACFKQGMDHKIKNFPEYKID